MSEEKKLPRYSYSKLDTFIQCPMKYKLKYIDGNYVDSEAIALEIGTIIHKVMELKHEKLVAGDEVDYGKLLTICKNGTVENHQKLLGVVELEEKYSDIFNEVNKKSGMTYHDKLNNFCDYLVNDKDLEDGWKTLDTEVKFEFVYNDRCILHGFIDRVDINEKGEIRVIDYKTANKIYDTKDLPTALQMFIYCLACEEMYSKTPVAFIYDMVFLGEKQNALTKGYRKRGIAKLEKTLDAIEAADSEGGSELCKPTPLCYYCDYSPTNPNSFPLNQLCPRYSLWRPDKKTFEIHEEIEFNLEEPDF